MSTPSLGLSTPSPRPPLEKEIGWKMSKGLNTNTLTVDIYSKILIVFENIRHHCSRISVLLSTGFSSRSQLVPFSPSEAYYPLLNEMSNSWIVLRKITSHPSTTPLEVESRYKSSFYHDLVVESLYKSSFYHPLVVESRFTCFLLSPPSTSP